MEAVAAAAAAASSPYHPRYPGGEWKTLQCVTAPKMLTMVGQPRQPRVPADTSGFVLIKFQVLSVAPEERPPQIEAAARTLHAMGTGTVQSAAQSLPEHHSAPQLYANHGRTSLIQPHAHPVIRNTHRSLNPETFGRPPNSPGASSSGSEHSDSHPCKFPGCAKTFERRYNLRVHMRRHTGETPYPCKQPGCAQMFKWRSSLAHHMKTRHKAGGAMLQLPKAGKVPASPGAITDIRASSSSTPMRTMRFTLVESPNGSSSGSGGGSGLPLTAKDDGRLPLSARNYGIYPGVAPMLGQSPNGMSGSVNHAQAAGLETGNRPLGLPRRQNMALPLPRSHAKSQQAPHQERLAFN